jgi:hypothetical protein
LLKEPSNLIEKKQRYVLFDFVPVCYLWTKSFMIVGCCTEGGQEGRVDRLLQWPCESQRTTKEGS